MNIETLSILHAPSGSCDFLLVHTRFFLTNQQDKENFIDDAYFQ